MMMNYFWILKLSVNKDLKMFMREYGMYLEVDLADVHSTIETITSWDWKQLIRYSGPTVYKMELFETHYVIKILIHFMH